MLARGGVAYSEAFPLGDAAEEVTRLAEKHDIDLVVMGSRGQTALKGLLLGSVASRVLALSKTPVTVIRQLPFPLQETRPGQGRRPRPGAGRLGPGAASLARGYASKRLSWSTAGAGTGRPPSN